MWKCGFSCIILSAGVFNLNIITKNLDLNETDWYEMFIRGGDRKQLHWLVSLEARPQQTVEMPHLFLLCLLVWLQNWLACEDISKKVIDFFDIWWTVQPWVI